MLLGKAEKEEGSPEPDFHPLEQRAATTGSEFCAHSLVKKVARCACYRRRLTLRFWMAKFLAPRVLHRDRKHFRRKTANDQRQLGAGRTRQIGKGDVLRHFPKLFPGCREGERLLPAMDVLLCNQCSGKLTGCGSWISAFYRSSRCLVHFSTQPEPRYVAVMLRVRVDEALSSNIFHPISSRLDQQRIVYNAALLQLLLCIDNGRVGSCSFVSLTIITTAV